MSDRPEDIGRNADKVVLPRINKMGRGLGLEALRRVMRKNPVDTGLSRANWNVSRGEPDYSTTVSTSESTAMIRGRMTIRPWQITKADLFVSNGVPYIERLEDGWSQQAPLGMARITVQELEPVARQIALRVARG